MSTVASKRTSTDNEKRIKNFRKGFEEVWKRLTKVFNISLTSCLAFIVIYLMQLWITERCEVALAGTVYVSKNGDTTAKEAGGVCPAELPELVTTIQAVLWKVPGSRTKAEKVHAVTVTQWRTQGQVRKGCEQWIERKNSPRFAFCRPTWPVRDGR